MIFEAQVQFASRINGHDRRTRYTAPQCADARKAGDNMACGHTLEAHLPDGKFYPQGAGDPRRKVCTPPQHDWGLRVNAKTKATYWAPVPRPTYTGTIPKRTLENIAACQALGLTYWSEAPGNNTLYAVDDQQVPHLVSINRNLGVAYGACDKATRYNPETKGPRGYVKCGHRKIGQSWSITDDSQLVLALHEEETMPRYISMDATKAEQAMADALNHPESAAKRIAATQNVSAPTGQTFAAALNLLHHDPDYLGDIDTLRLQEILECEGEKRFHPRIRVELRQRQKRAG